MKKECNQLTLEQLKQFQSEGYLLVKGLFLENELQELDRTFEEISHQVIPGHFEPDFEAGSQDPLKRYPRVMHPHRFSETAKRYMLHPNVIEVLEDLYNEEVLAAQSMFYYKPPGSRGQALHQDNFYLQVEPGNCIAAWTAMDPATLENGGLLIVPKTGGYDLGCPQLADAEESFTTHFVKPPKDISPIPAIMDRGDVLFFNGNLIHGSYRNKTQDQFRRAFICHYANASALRINDHYRPLYKPDGSVIDLEINPDGGPCGVEFQTIYPH